MAEDPSTLEPKTSNLSSNDSSINSVQGSMDFHAGLIHESRIDDQKPVEVDLSSFLDQIKQSQVEQAQQSESNGEIQLESFANLHNPMKILENDLEIEAIGDCKEEQIVGFVGTLETNEKKEAKKEKRSRRRSKKQLNASASIHDFEKQTVCDCDKRGDRARVVYIRADMEALRFFGIEEQNKKWLEVYCGLGAVVAKEYDSLIGSAHEEKGDYVNFDPRSRFVKNKDADADFVGEDSDMFRNTNQLDHVSGVNNNDLDGAEDYNEDEDSDEEYVSIQRPAFLVTGEPDFDSGPPQDGLEYLRRVRWEAEHIPKVKVTKVKRNVLIKEQTVYMPNIPDIVACPEHLRPSKEWEDAFLADFSELRLALSCKTGSNPLADSLNESMIQENLVFCQTDSDTGVIQENLDFRLTDWPSLLVVLEMEPVARVSMLRKRITALENASSLSRNDCAWLFALCAVIDTPLDGDTSASLRCLLRKCASLRAERSDFDDEVVMLSILVTISGKFFGQSETS